MLKLIIIGIVIAVVVAYLCSEWARYWLKFTIYFCGIMTTPLLSFPLIVWRPCDARNMRIGMQFIRWISPVLGVTWEVRGAEHATPERAAIVVSNHQSSVDVLGMIHVVGLFKKITIIAKRELLYFQPVGGLAWLAGICFLNRRNPTTSKASMDQALANIKKNKIKMWIFPEGTRNKTPQLLPFKKGAFHCAITGQIPIIPVVFSSYNGFMGYQRFFNSGTARCTVLPPVSTEGLTLEDLPSLMEKVRQQMIEAFTTSTKEVQQQNPAQNLNKKVE